MLILICALLFVGLFALIGICVAQQRVGFDWRTGELLIFESVPCPFCKESAVSFFAAVGYEEKHGETIEPSAMRDCAAQTLCCGNPNCTNSHPYHRESSVCYCPTCKGWTLRANYVDVECNGYFCSRCGFGFTHTWCCGL